MKTIARRKCPKYTVKSAPIKRYMGFADSFKKPPTLIFLLQINEFFILK